jgi:2-oxoglutarate ferredoxin oxidoreductase subunit gamma
VSRYGLVISGFGGQGVLFVGYLFSYAAMLEDKKVTWVPSYGVEMRGGTAHCSIQISEQEINSPLIEEPNALVALNRPSFEKFSPTINGKGVVFFNKSLTEKVPQVNGLQVISIEASDEAKRLGDARVANLIILGALVQYSKVLDIDNLYRALEKILPPHRYDSIEVNLKALKKGFEYDLVM